MGGLPRAPPHSLILCMSQFSLGFVPALSTDLVSKISRSQPSKFIETISPGNIQEDGVNHRKNFVAVDSGSAAVVSSLLMTALLLGVPVGSDIPSGKNTIVRVFSDVDTDPPHTNLASVVFSNTAVTEVRRFGTMQGVILVFRVGCLPCGEE